MKILVTAKRVIDPEAKITVKSDGSGIEAEADYFLNEYDDRAIWAASDISSEHDDVEIVSVCIGSEDAIKELRRSLAFGGDRGILVEAEEEEIDGDLVARTLAAIWKQEQPDLFILGRQASDGDSNQVGQLLAEYVGAAQVCFASSIEVGDGTVRVEREIDGGIETLDVKLPAVLTAESRLATERHLSLPAIMKAKRKKVEFMDLDDLDVDEAIKVKTVAFEPPPARKAGVRVADVNELFGKLKNEAKVL